MDEKICYSAIIKDDWNLEKWCKPEVCVSRKNKRNRIFEHKWIEKQWCKYASLNKEMELINILEPKKNK